MVAAENEKTSCDPRAELMERAIKTKGRRKSEVAREIGIEYKTLQAIISGSSPFPDKPEFEVVVAHVLQLTPRSFTLYRELSQSNPSAALLIDHLASRLKGRYGEGQGKKRLPLDQSGEASERKKLFASFRARGAKGGDSYWNKVLAGTEPFPRTPAVLEAVADSLGVPPSDFREYPLKGLELSEDAVIRRLLAEKLKTLDGRRKPKDALSRIVMRVGECTDKAAVRAILRRIVSKGWDLRGLAKALGKSYDDLVLMLLGLIPINNADLRRMQVALGLSERLIVRKNAKGKDRGGGQLVDNL